MKYLIFFNQSGLVLAIVLLACSCNNTSKPAIVQDSTQMWKSYLKENPSYDNTALPESWFFHNNKKDADRLALLTAQGKKQATSGLYLWYRDSNTQLPPLGIHHIITDFEGNAKAIIQITKVDTVPFKNISAAYAALDIGSEIEPLAKWKKAHKDFFTSALKENNIVFNDSMLVVCEEFKTVWPK